jgi:hypothetical protein
MFLYLSKGAVKIFDNKRVIAWVFIEESHNGNAGLFNKLLKSIHIEVLQACGFVRRNQ